MQSLAVQILSRLLLAAAPADMTQAEMPPDAIAQAQGVAASRATPDLLAQAGASRSRPVPGPPAPVDRAGAGDVIPQPEAAERSVVPPSHAQPVHDHGSVIAQYEQLSENERKQFVRQLIAGRLQAAEQMALDDAELVRHREIDDEILLRLAEGQTISSRGLVKLLRKLDAFEHAAIENLARGYRIEVYSQFHSDRAQYDAHLAAWNRVEAAWQASGKTPDEQRKLIDWLRSATDRLRADHTAKLPSPPSFGPGPSSRVAERRLVPPRLAEMRRPPAPAKPQRLEPAPTAAAQRSWASQLPELPAAVTHTPSPPPRPTDAVTATLRAPQAAPTDVPRPTISRRAPLAKQSPELRIAMKPIQRPAEPAASARPAPNAALEPQAGRIDLEELSVRIAGHNLALARLAGRLQEHGLWEIDRLTTALADLEDLTARRGDLLLYWELIGENERLLVGVLHSPAGPITMLGAKITAARVSVVGHHETPADGVHDERAANFDHLSRRLAHLAAGAAR